MLLITLNYGDRMSRIHQVAQNVDIYFFFWRS